MIKKRPMSIAAARFVAAILGLAILHIIMENSKK